MTSSSSRLTPYPISLHSHNLYNFTTDSGNQYALYFTDAAGYFNGNPIGENALTFGIELVKAASAPKLLDARIGATIAAFIGRTLEADQHLIILYICDTKDNRQYLRKYKFERWYHGYNDGSVVRLEIRNNHHLPAFLLHHRHHPAPAEISRAVIDLEVKLR